MDGINRALIITGFILFSTQPAFAVTGKACNFECPIGKSAAKEIDNFLNQKKSCPFPKMNSEDQRNPAKGAAFMDPLVTTNGEFISEALRVQGLRMFEADEDSPNQLPKNLEISDMKEFGKGGRDCFNPVYLSSNLKSGDMIIMDSQAIILDQIPSDPFNIQTNLDSKDLAAELARISRENPKQVPLETVQHVLNVLNGKPESVLSSEVNAAAGLICNDWTGDPALYKTITAFHETVDPAGPNAIRIKSESLIPNVLGESTSPGTGLSNLMERAEGQCKLQVFEAIKKRTRSVLYVGPAYGHFTVLRHQSDIPQCRVTCSHCANHVENTRK